MMRAVFTDSERDFLKHARVARLATADGSGDPHVVPIVFALDGNTVYTPLDDKPKRVPLKHLTRVRNIVANPHVALVVDEYDEDWTRLAWVLVRGTAAVCESGSVQSTGIRLLREKYPQYEQMTLDGRPIIVITPTAIASWGAGFGVRDPGSRSTSPRI